MKDVINVDEWKVTLKNFVKQRNWQNFHNPKNLVMNLSGEAAELMEIYTWVNSEDSKKTHLNSETKEHIRQEIGDVFMTLIMLADELDLSLSEALKDKFILTAKKYPAKSDNV